MNLFVFADCLIENAKYFFATDFKRAQKQIVEACQVLAQISELQVPKAKGGFYKFNKSIRNHPATIWVDRHHAHFTFCLEYIEALLEEYHRIQGKHHGCTQAFKVLSQDYRNQGRRRIKLGWHTHKATPFELLGFEPTCNEDIHQANKVYLDCKLNGMYGN